MDNKMMVFSVIIGFFGFLLLKYGLEPWTIKTVCENMMNCK